MKRSLALKCLLNSYHDSQRGGMSEMSDEERMDYLLTCLEDLGMLPPSSHNTLTNYPDGFKVGEQFLCMWDNERAEDD